MLEQCVWMVWGQPKVPDCGFPATRTHVENTKSLLAHQQWKLFIKICLTPWRLPVLWGNQNCGAKRLSATCWNGLMYLNCDEWSPGGKSAHWCTGKENLLVYKLSLQTAGGFIPGLKKWLTSCFSVQHTTVGWVEKLRLLSAGTAARSLFLALGVPCSVVWRVILVTRVDPCLYHV